MVSDNNRGKILGERLSNLRKNMGNEQGYTLSRAKVAEDIGCSESSLSQWEGGKQIPSAIMLRKLALFYNVSSDYVLGDTSYPERPAIERKDGLINWKPGLFL